MQWELMSKMDAAQITGTWQGLDKESFDKLVNNWEKWAKNNKEFTIYCCNARKHVVQ